MMVYGVAVYISFNGFDDFYVYDIGNRIICSDNLLPKFIVNFTS